MSGEHLLSELQLAIMRILWERSEATVSDVHETLQGERALAPTTVATVLSRLEKRGLVRHRRDGRQFVYRTVVTDRQVLQSAVDDLAERVFRGDVTNLVSHLLSARDLSPGDLARVKALIEDKERQTSEPEEVSDDD
jgi:predicted transcriptional regulator